MKKNKEEEYVDFYLNKINCAWILSIELKLLELEREIHSIHKILNTLEETI